MKQLAKFSGFIACLFFVLFFVAAGSCPVMAGDKDCESDKWKDHPICADDSDPDDPDPDPVEGPNHALAINGYEKGLDLYVVDVDGGNPTRVVRRASGHPAPAGPTVWSPDGTRIIWSDLSYQNLQMVNVDGSNRQEILTRTEEMTPYIGGQKNLAPSGYDCPDNNLDEPEPANLLYFLGLAMDESFDNIFEDSWEDFYYIDLDNPSIPPVQLTDNPSERHTTLDVSPDGQLIATWTWPSESGYYNPDVPDGRLEIRDACTYGLPVIESWTAEQLGQLPGYQFFGRIDWSSKDILAISGHSSTPGLPEDIYLIDLSAPEAVKIIGSGMNFGADVDNRRATWSPDGTLLAFTSDHDVYIYNFITNVYTRIAGFKTNRDIDWRPTWEAVP